MTGISLWTTKGWIISSIIIVVLTVVAIVTPIVISILVISSNTITTTVATLISFNIATTYGDMNYISIDDNDEGYLCIDAVDVVGQTNGTITSSYVEQISFIFCDAPTTLTPGIWLYVMDRTDSTNVFSPTIIYQLPYSLITVDAIGLQTMTLSSDALPVRKGQYVGVGFENSGGSLYRVVDRNQYFADIFDFSTVSSTSYSLLSQGGFAFTFVVRTIGYISD